MSGPVVSAVVAPAAPSSQPPAVGPAADSRPRQSTPQGYWQEKLRGRVLVVDDEAPILRSIRRLLRAKGYEVETAPNGHAAVEKFSTGTFDVILSDIAMPGMDGIELLQAVRRHDPDVPVVLITGEPAVKTAVKALEYGAFHYLTKPVALPELEEVVDKAASLRRMTQMKRQAAELLGNRVAVRDRYELEQSFGRALDSLWIAFQPIVRASDGDVYGYEGLLRSSEESLPHPGAVLDAAEHLGALDILGRSIRDRAADAMSAAPANTALFVNLHTTDLLDPLLQDGDAPLSQISKRVVLEVTERASLDSVSDVRGRIGTLRGMGFRVAIDDLGAGYAGLTSFAMLEPEIIKLDMSLIRDVHMSATKQKLIRSMTSLARDMGMMVVGEGVETTEERDSLIELGCDLLQGYLLAKPGKPFPEVSW